MTITEAKNIGSRQGLITVGLGHLFAQLIMTLMIYPSLLLVHRSRLLDEHSDWCRHHAYSPQVLYEIS